MRRWPRPTLPRLIALAATAWITLWACAPTAMRPVPVGLDIDRSTEVGAAAGVELAPPERDLPLGETDGVLETGALQAHVGGQITPRFYLDLVTGARLPVDDRASGGAGLGLRARLSLVDERRFFLGADVGVGLIYAEAAVPLGVRVSDGFALWTGPGIALGPGVAGTWPLGMTWRVDEHVDFSLQTALVGPLGIDSSSEYALPRFPLMAQMQWRFGVNRGR